VIALIPLIAIVLALAAYFLGRKEAAGSRPTLLGILGLLIFIVLGTKFGFVKGSEMWPLGLGMLAAAFAATVAEWLGVATTAVGLGVAAAAMAPFLGKGAQTAELGMIVGAMAATLFSRAGANAALAAVATAAVAGADSLGRLHADTPNAASIGAILGLAATGIGVIMMVFPTKGWRWVIGSVLIAGVGYLAAKRMVPAEGVALPAVLGALAGAVVMLQLPEDQSDPLRMGIATVIWLGLATLAYGPGKGFGMSVALLTGLAVPLALGRGRVLISAGPLAAMLAYRVFEATNGKTGEALDIGTHYVLIGFAVGVVLPAIADEWRGRLTRLPALGALLWCLLFIGIPVILSAVVEAKGVVGFVAGLGFVGLLLVRREQVTAIPLALVTGLGAMATLVYNRMSVTQDLAKHEKQHVVAYAIVAIVVLAIPLAWLALPTAEEKKS
jgi:hypothetical protein